MVIVTRQRGRFRKSLFLDVVNTHRYARKWCSPGTNECLVVISKVQTIKNSVLQPMQSINKHADSGNKSEVKEREGEREREERFENRQQ